MAIRFGDHDYQALTTVEVTAAQRRVLEVLQGQYDFTPAQLGVLGALEALGDAGRTAEDAADCFDVSVGEILDGLNVPAAKIAAFLADTVRRLTFETQVYAKEASRQGGTDGR